MQLLKYPGLATGRLACILASALMALTACNTAPSAPYYQIQGRALGTFYSITYQDSLARNFAPQIDSLLQEIENQFSIYDSTSVISRFNASSWGIVNRPFATLTTRAVQLVDLTHGFFDPTIAPVAAIWGFGEIDFRQADTAAALAALAHCGTSLLRIAGDSVIKTDSLLHLTYNAFAKGYAVDYVGQIFQRSALENFLIEIGGEVLAQGVNARGKPWVVGIEYPERGLSPQARIAERVALSRGAIATSGNYRQYIESEGASWGHTINPHTGLPEKNELLSATVYAPDCATADAVATALMAMGLQKAIALIQRHDSLDALLLYIDRDRTINAWQSGYFDTMAQ